MTAEQTVLLGRGLAFSRHSGVIAAFGEHFAKAGRVPAKFHRYLIEAQDKRNVGDYDIGPALSAEDTEGEMSRAEEFLEMVGRQLASP